MTLICRINQAWHVSEGGQVYSRTPGEWFKEYAPGVWKPMTPEQSEPLERAFKTMVYSSTNSQAPKQISLL